LGFVHLLKSGRLTPDETLDFLGRMEKELGRMDGIIRSLLNFARSRPQGAGPVDLKRSAAEALSLAEVQKWFTGLEVQTRYQKDLPPAKAEGGAVTQVLLNLLANAGRAMNGQGRLTLATGREGEDVFVAVEDTGPGISLEDQKRIFEPFFTTRAPGEGTGLGLSVSLSLMESFGGRIDVVSQPGQGSTFRAVWPLYQEAPGGGG
jgi:signal transduction histidine kinase